MPATRLILVAAAFLAIGLAVGPALATGFGSIASGGSPASSVSLANNKWHYVYDAFMDDSIRTSLRWSRDNVYGTTDLDTYTGTFEVHDVVATSGDYGVNGLVAWANCPGGATVSGSHPNQTCYGQSLAFNQNSTYSAYYDTENERRYVTCHELGHTVGLQHQSTYTSCLNSGNYSITYISSHEEDHINDYYE